MFWGWMKEANAEKRQQDGSSSFMGSVCTGYLITGWGFIFPGFCVHIPSWIVHYSKHMWVIFHLKCSETETI